VKAALVLRIAIVLTLGLSVQAAYAAPSRIAAELRAASCCARTCPKGQSLESAAHCCRVRPAAIEIATLSKTQRVQLSAVCNFGPALAAASAPFDRLGVLLPSRDPHERATPIFLLTRSLRL
jgi:hypothetical protein